MRLLLFDIDGTLIRARGLGRRALDLAFADLYGWEQATREVSFLGLTDPLIVRQVFERHERSEAEADEHQARIFARYLERLAELVAEPDAGCDVLPGIEELLGRLRSRSDCLLGLLTGNVREGARLKLELCSLWEPFVLGAFGEDGTERNELFAPALERAGGLAGRSFAPEEVVVIGDTARDVEVGRVHGARTLAVATGWVSREDLEREQPTLALEDLSDVAAVEDFLCG